LCFSGGVCVKRVAAPFDSERQFKRIADNGGFHPELLIHCLQLALFPETGFADSQDCIPAIALLETMLVRHLPNEVFDSSGRELDSTPANITDQMQMVGLLDNGFIARQTLELRL